MSISKLNFAYRVLWGIIVVIMFLKQCTRLDELSLFIATEKFHGNCYVNFEGLHETCKVLYNVPTKALLVSRGYLSTGK